jgi:hypothetical protein
MKLLELKDIEKLYIHSTYIPPFPSKYAYLDSQLWNNLKSQFYSDLCLRKIHTQISGIIYSQVMLQMKRNIRIES